MSVVSLLRPIAWFLEKTYRGHVGKFSGIGQRIFENRSGLSGLNCVDQVVQFDRSHFGRLHDQQHIVPSFRMAFLSSSSSHSEIGVDASTNSTLYCFCSSARIRSRGNPYGFTVGIHCSAEYQGIGLNDPDGFPLATGNRVDRPHQFVFDRHPVRHEGDHDPFQSTGKSDAEHDFLFPNAPRDWLRHRRRPDPVFFFGQNRFFTERFNPLVQG